MKKRNGILARIGIVALVLTLVTTTMTSGTLAKYITQADATVTAMVAKWDPSIVIGGQDAMVTAVEFDLMDNYTGGTVNDIVSGLIAPGTGSSFNIELDAKNSQVNTEYAVYMFYDTSSGTAPSNLVFATNDTFTSSVTAKGVNNTDFTALLAGTTVPSGTGTDSGYVAGGDLTVVGETIKADFAQTIYWRWPYQTAAGDNSDTATENQQDTKAGSEATGTDLKYAIVVVMTQKGA